MVYDVPMYIDEVPNRNSPPCILLRESQREGNKVHKRTLANITHWPPEQVESLRRILRGEILVPLSDLFSIECSHPHGHVKAVLGTIRKLGLDQLIASKSSRQRNLVIALIVERILHPDSKLATTRTWTTTTLAEELGLEDADVDEVYEALDWIFKRQKRIEKKLAARHLTDDGLALYDISSSSYEGRTCTLACFGKNRDGKKDLRCITYGLLTDADGRPVSIDVYPGNTGDPSTVPDQAEKLLKQFNLTRVVFVGDRGMLTEAQIRQLKHHPEVGWISALRSSGIRGLMESGTIQMSLFDKQNLAEITSPSYPGERLIACYNPLLAGERRRKRKALLDATEVELQKIQNQVNRRTKTPLEKDEIGVKVGRVINKYKMAKHFELTIEDNLLEWQRREETIEKETALDGIYVIRTSEKKERLPADDVVRDYKRLTLVEKAFRCLKGVDLKLRPVFLRMEDHVRAHFFICMLAYYVEWHMRRALAPLLFEDEEVEEDRKRRDPVAPTQPSESVKLKKTTRQTEDGLPLHSFSTLLEELGTLCKNTCRMKTGPSTEPFFQLTEASLLQRRVFELLGL